MKIFVKLSRGECDKNCTAFARIGNVSLPKSTLSQHFKALREAGLIHSERKGVELLNHTRCAELKDTFGPLIETIIAAYAKETHRPGKAPAVR
jgi:DNA-binding transcriptional ArsR family regulator